MGADIKTLSCKAESTSSAAAQPMRLLDWQFLGEASNYPPIKLSSNVLNIILILINNP